jgi:molecular chaperone IbpA
MTSKDLSIFNSLRPFSIGFDDMFDQFENMLGNGKLDNAVKLSALQH